MIGRIAWSPDGQTLASASTDRTIRLWDTKTGELRRTITVCYEAQVVHSLTWSPDGKTLASGTTSPIIRVWDAETGELCQELEGHMDSVISLAWSPDGQMLASGSQDPCVMLWDMSVGRPIGLARFFLPVISVAWSPSGQTLASGSQDGTLVLWDRKTGQLRELTGIPTGIYSIVWLSDDTTLASANLGINILLWDSDTGRQTHILEGHTSPVIGASLSCGGEFLASRSYDNTVRLWRPGTWQMVAVLNETISISDFRIYTPHGLAFHPKALILATVSEEEGENVIRIWDLDSVALLGASTAVKT